MATDQNIKNKTLASEIDTAYGRWITVRHGGLACLTSQESFLAIYY